MARYGSESAWKCYQIFHKAQGSACYEHTYIFIPTETHQLLPNLPCLTFIHCSQIRGCLVFFKTEILGGWWSNLNTPPTYPSTYNVHVHCTCTLSIHLFRDKFQIHWFDFGFFLNFKFLTYYLAAIPVFPSTVFSALYILWLWNFAILKLFHIQDNGSFWHLWQRPYFWTYPRYAMTPQTGV